MSDNAKRSGGGSAPEGAAVVKESLITGGIVAKFGAGDWVKTNPDSEYEYEVAEIRRLPHGFMVGIYDEPPSGHVDFWNAASLTLARTANASHEGRRESEVEHE